MSFLPFERGSRPPVRVVAALTSGCLSGVDIFSFRLVCELNRRGRPAELALTQSDFPEPWPIAIPADVPHARLDVPRGASRRRRWTAMIDHLEARRPCIYLPNYDFQHSAVCPRLGRGVYVVGIVHSDDPLHFEHAVRLGPYWDGIVSVSSAIQHELTTTVVPELAGRCVYIPYGVPSSTAPPVRATSGPLRLIYAGRLEQTQKRVLDLAPLLDELHRRSIPVVLTIAGSGPEEERLRDVLRQHVNAGRAVLAGIVAPSELIRVLAESDIFVLPSQFEGQSIALLEAMGQGVVPVATATRSGARELIDHGRNGLLARIGDPLGLADRIESLARDPSLRKKLARNAWETVHDGPHSIAHMADRYEQLFDRVLRDRGQARPRGPIRPAPELRRQLPVLRRLRGRVNRIFDSLRPHRSANAPVDSPRTHRRRVAFLVTRQSTPSETFIRDQVRALRSRGITVDVFAEDEPSRPIARTEAGPPPIPPMPGPRMHRVLDACMHLTKNLDRAPVLLRAVTVARNRTCTLRTFYDALPFLRRERYDVLHAHHGPNGVRAAHLLAAGAASCPLVTTFYGDDVAWCENDPSRVTPLFASTSRLLVISDEMRDRLAPWSAPAQPEVMRLGVDLERFQPREAEARETRHPRVMSLARLVPNKGLEIAVRSVARLVETGRPLIYDCIGDGPLASVLHELARDLGIDHVIRFHGWLPHDRIAELLPEADLLIAPSIATADAREGTPVAILEAQACGVPVVATRHAGIPEIVADGETGLLVAEGDPDALADAIAALLDQPERRVAMGQRARQHMRRRHDLAVQAERMIELYESLCGSR